ncbi:MAG TPA: hypothetical protein VJK54_09410, partial [Chthoniobacterales bacterium]|nr:hypothetical protein [Chthoniobacterales bacterium]
MKKLISSILLAVSVSSSFLLAKSESKQVIGTNQVTSDRLKDRLEAIGYRLEEERNQEAGSREATLLLGDKISQQVGPTTNCDNQGDNLDCYLLMDPVELKKVQEGIEDLKGLFGSPKKADLGVSTAAHSPVESGSSRAAMSETRGSEATAILTHDETAGGNSTNAFLEDEICNNIYTSCLARVAEMSRSKSIVVNGTSETALQEPKEWAAAEKKAERDVHENEQLLQDAKEELQLAKERLNATQPHLHGEATYSNARNDYNIKTLAQALAKAKVKTAEVTLFAIRVKGTTQSTGAEVNLAKSIEKEQEACNNLEIATGRREGGVGSSSFTNVPAAPQSPVLFTPPRPPVSGFKAIKTEQISTPSIPSNKEVAKDAAEILENLTFAQKLKIARDRDAASKAAISARSGIKTQSTSASSESLQSTPIRLLSKLASADEVQGADGAQKLSVQKLLDASGADISSPSLRDAVETDEARRMKNFDTRDVGNESFYAEGQNSNLTQHSSSLPQVAVDGDETIRFNTGVTKQFTAEVEFRKKSITESEKTKSVQQEAVALERNEKIKIAREKEQNCTENRAKYQKNIADSLEKAIQYEAKSEEFKTAGNTTLAEKYTKAAEQSEKAAEQFAQAAELNEDKEYWLGKEIACNGCYEVGRCTQLSADTMIQASELFAAEDNALAKKYAELSAKYQLSAEQFAQAVKVLENDEDSYRTADALQMTAWCTKLVASSMKYRFKAADALKNNKAPHVVEYTTASEKMTQAAECFQQSAVAYVEEKFDIVRLWQRAGQFSQCEVETLEQAIEAEANGRTEVAQAWREAAKQHQLFKEFFTKKAIAYTAGNKEEYKTWEQRVLLWTHQDDYITNNLEKVAKHLEKAIEAEANGRTEVAQAWREAVKQNQLAAEFYAKGATAYTKGKSDEGDNWNSVSYAYKNAADGLEKVANHLEKAIEAETNGKPEVAQAWREAVKHNQFTTESYTKEAIAHVEGKSDEGNNWNSVSYAYKNAADGLEKVAAHLEKAIEAEGKGKRELAQAWREAVTHNQFTAESYTKAAIAYIAGKSDEGSNWRDAGDAYSDAGDGLENVAKHLEKAIEAETSGRPEVAQAWREVAKQ